MTALPDPNALLQMARALGLHPVVTHAPDSEDIAAVRVYHSELDNRAVVTWEATGIVCHAGLSWAPCSLAEASAVLEIAAREAADERAVRAVAEAARRDAENAVATAQIEAECSGVEACGCDESQWWKRRAASLEAARHEAETTASAALADMVRRGIEICGCEESAWLRGENERLTWDMTWAMAQAARLAKELKAAQVASATPETTLESRPHAREFALAKIEESLGDRDIEGDRWLQTITGAPFFLFSPVPGDFDIPVIAHALSNMCRFNGHTKRFYSVAEHSVLVMMILREQGEPVSVQMAGLLHDAAEAYIGDMVRPLKVSLPAYKVVEERIERALAERFDLPWPWPAAVKEADNIALAVEKRDLLAPSPRPWRNLPDVPEQYRLFLDDSNNYRSSFIRWFENLAAERRNAAGCG